MVTKFKAHPPPDEILLKIHCLSIQDVMLKSTGGRGLRQIRFRSSAFSHGQDKAAARTKAAKYVFLC